MKMKSENNHQKKLSKLEIKYDQIRNQLIDDLDAKLNLMIEEEELFIKLYRIQQKMKLYIRKMENN